jgi:hypothetical protein
MLLLVHSHITCHGTRNARVKHDVWRRRMLRLKHIMLCLRKMDGTVELELELGKPLPRVAKILPLKVANCMHKRAIIGT